MMLTLVSSHVETAGRCKLIEMDSHSLDFFGAESQESYSCSTASAPTCHSWGPCSFSLTGVEVKIFKVDHVDINKKMECPKAPALDTIDELYEGLRFSIDISTLSYFQNI